MIGTDDEDKPEVRTRAVPGAPYTIHSLFYRGVLVAEQLSPFSANEIADRVKQLVAPGSEQAALRKGRQRLY